MKISVSVLFQDFTPSCLRDCVRLAIRKITYAPERPQPQVSFLTDYSILLVLTLNKEI